VLPAGFAEATAAAPLNASVSWLGETAEAVESIVSYTDIMTLAGKHRKVLARIFREPPPPDIRWTDVETFLVALGAELSEGSGSRVRIALGGVRAVFHRPHPRPELGRAAVRSLRRFLVEAGLSEGG